jgi:predicted dehydrogenase
MEQVGAAMVGAGHWGERHAYAYHRLPQARLVGICDIDQQRASVVGSADTVAVR